ncbi:MAG TPA: M1 family aminopeptidase [Candidatus Eisenbacteria bacterium]|nr:M1 family aminopeptidase [Candidatus Eisenbacteria bacterium]
MSVWRRGMAGFAAIAALLLTWTPRTAASTIPDLPPADVVRLSEEARWLFDEGKLQSAIATDRAAGRLGVAAVAAESLHSYDAIHYRLDVTLSRTSNLISGTMTLDLEVVDPAITQIDLHDQGLNVLATRVNGVSRTSSVAAGKLLIPVCQGGDCPPHGAGDPLQVSVDYSASPPQVGFYYYGRNSYTMSEPYDARYWMPCYDLPFDKATLDVYCTAPDSNVCVSNGVLLSVTPGAPGTSVYHWQETHPISTYLIAITVGRFWQWTQTAGTLPILQNVFPEDSTKAKFDFANIPAMFPVFEARWGPYAFDKYGQVAVTPFGAGGMEHQSLTTINRSWVTGTRSQENGMAHELAHQWWGDMVTCVDFRNIWLNEGFASYGECLWQEGFYGAAAYASYIQSQMTSALNSDNGFRYALYDPPAANLFGNTIYKKGSLVLHMLRRVLGDASFYAGMQLYGQRFRYGTASTADFAQAMEDASGQDLDWYFSEWVYDKGLPTYDWSWQSAAGPPGKRTVVVTIRQTQTNAPLFRMPIEFKVQRAGLPDTNVTVINDALAIQNLLFDVEGATVTNVVLDPRNSIYKRVQPRPVDVAVELGPGVAMRVSPNPTSGGTRVAVRLSATTRAAIEVTIYDSAGRAVRSLGASRPGLDGASFDWDLRDGAGRPVAAGLYFAQARAGASHEERPIIVTR